MFTQLTAQMDGYSVDDYNNNLPIFRSANM